MRHLNRAPEFDALRAYKLYKTGLIYQSELAKIFDVGQAAISHQIIKYRKLEEQGKLDQRIKQERKICK